MAIRRRCAGSLLGRARDPIPEQRAGLPAPAAGFSRQKSPTPQKKATQERLFF